jgi:hypothetical protein
MRRTITTAAILAALGAVLAFGPAGAQPATETHVISSIVVTPVNGFVTLPEAGTADGVEGIACTGAFPLGGPVIPSQVVTHLETNQTTLRLLRPTTSGSVAINGVAVEINCAVESSAAPATALERRAR